MMRMMNDDDNSKVLDIDDNLFSEGVFQKKDFFAGFKMIQTDGHPHKVL